MSLASLLSSPHCTLSYLNLQGNRIGPDGLAALAGAVRASRTLVELVVTDNGIGGVANGSGGAGTPSLISLEGGVLPVGDAASAAADIDAVAAGGSAQEQVERSDAATSVAMVAAAAAVVPAFPLRVALRQLGEALSDPNCPLHR